MLMAHLFSHGIRGEPTKQTPIGEMPESWEVVTLASRCDVKTSFPAFDTIPQLNTGRDSDELVLALKVSDMTSEGNEKYLDSGKLSFRHARTEAIRRKFLRPQSIVFPKRGAAIATNKKRVTLRYAILDPNVIGVEPCDTFDPAYLFGFFERFDLRSLQDNTPIPQLNKHNVEAVLLPVPAYEEQQEIGAVLAACDAKIAALEQDSALLDELFRALLEELMTGRLSVGG